MTKSIRNKTVELRRAETEIDGRKLGGSDLDAGKRDARTILRKGERRREIERRRGSRGNREGATNPESNGSDKRGKVFL